MPVTGRRAGTAEALGALRHAVVAGRFAALDMLPGERELADAFAVSRTTLRRLVADLVDEGLLRHRQGVGTFVARRPVPHPSPPPAPAALSESPRLRGFTEVCGARGEAVSTRVLARQTGTPTPDEAILLGCAPDTPVLRLTRLRSTAAGPLAWHRTTLPLRFLGTTTPETGLYAALAAAGFAPMRALQRIRTGLAGVAAADLGLVPAAPVIVVQRIAYDANGTPLEATNALWPADRFDALVDERAGA